jgi:hypothetical protein
MSSFGHISWVSPSQLESNWLPEFFAPRFREVDETLLSGAGEFQRLGDLVRVSGSPRSIAAPPDWLVRRRGGAMSIERPASHDDVTSKRAFWLPLPDECVVLDAMVFHGVGALFWSSTIISGEAVATRSSYVLSPTSKRDIAWLEAAFSDPFVVAQLERASLGGLLPRISVQDLLEVRVPLLQPDKERSASELVRRSLARRREGLRLSRDARNQIVHGAGASAGVPLLTAATFEERIEQFERVLMEREIATPGTAFFIQAARDDQESDLFIPRSIGWRGGGSIDPALAPRCNDDESVNRSWRNWYWNVSEGVEYAVFNGIAGGPELPSQLLTRTVAHPAHLAPPFFGTKVIVPGFAEYRAALESSRDAENELDLADALRLEEDEHGGGGRRR